jgi:MoxR-like ATPase
MSKQQTFDRIFALPIKDVLTAYAKRTGNTSPATKAAAAESLTTMIINGQISFDDLFETSAPAQAFDTSKVDAAAQAAGRAEQVALDALNLTRSTRTLAHDLSNAVTTLQSGMTMTDDAITALHDGLQRLENKPLVDPLAVNREVTQAVADAFKPFAKAVADAGAEEVVGNMVAATVIDSRPALDVFGIDIRDVHGNPVQVDIWNHPDAPRIDPMFIWTEGILRHFLLTQKTGENTWLGGAKGTGKTSAAAQFAAHTGRRFVRINFEKHTEAAHYLGDTGYNPTQGTVFQPRDFLIAFSCPSTVILLDEVTNAAAGNLAPLNALLEPDCAVTYGGAVRRRAAGVLIFAADNTLGNGDDSGRYVDTRQMNSALIDRFARVITFNFLPIDEEVRAVVNHTGCKPDLAHHILKAVNVARQKVQTGEVVDAPSIRSVIGFIRGLEMLSVDDAWNTAIVARQPVESHAAIDAIKQACIDPSFIISNL